MAEENTNNTAAAFVDLGISGVQRYGAISRVYEEFLRELQGPQGMKLYREALDNDPVMGAVFFAIQYLCRSVRFNVVPAKTGGNKAGEVAERVRGAMFDDMDTSWPDQLSEILTMCPYGWALHEVTWKKCTGWGEGESLLPQKLQSINGQGPKPPAFTPSRYDDGFIGWKSWSLRAQDTLFMWEWDAESRAIAMQQMAPPDYRVRRIPMAKSLLFRAQIAKQNPEGRSMMRNAMTSYLLKKNLQIVEAVGIERDLAGYPVISTVAPDPTKGLVPPDIWNSKDPDMVALNAQIHKIGKSIRRDEQECLVKPWWLTFELMTSGGSRSFDTGAIISRYDKNIAISVLADFIMLGHESVGSKALASTKSELFTTALNSVLDSICAIINRFAIPQLLRLNGLSMELCPTLTHGSPEHIPLEVLGLYIQELAKSGQPLFPNAELEEALLNRAHLPIGGVSEVGAKAVAITNKPEVGKPGEEGAQSSSSTDNAGEVENE